MNLYLWISLFCQIGTVLDMVYLSEARNNCTIFDMSGIKVCFKKCCGLWKHAICAESCEGFSCEVDSQCDDGCCQEGRCKASDCFPSRLIIAVASTTLATLAVFTIVMLLRCWFHKKRKLISRNVNCSIGHHVNMDEPYWRVKSLESRTKPPKAEAATNNEINNGFHIT